MATVTESIASTGSKPQASAFPAASARFEWTFAALTLWVIGGLYLDGWAHSHGRVDDTFFTPWHGLLYSGVLVIAIFLFLNQWRNMDRGYPLLRALPVGYLWSLVGSGLFIAGGGLDLIWHTLFGFEVDLETLLSPTHLLLATSGLLMVTGPLRSAFARLPAGQRGWRALGPALICVLATLSLLTFFTSFADPVAESYAEAYARPDQDRYSDLYAMNADGTGQMRLTADEALFGWGGAWSPDGSRIVFTRGDPAEDDSNLYVANADGSGAALLADIPGGEYRVDWSPDGNQIAFVSDHDGGAEIGVIDADGSHFRVLTQTEAREYGPVWSPDGRRIAFTSNRDGGDNVYVMDADGSNVTRLTQEGLYNNGADWSADGTKIVFSSYRHENTDLYLMNADGSGVVRLTSDASSDEWPSFSADGKAILFTSWRSGSSDIFALDSACLSQPEPCDATATNLSGNHALRVEFPTSSPANGKILYTALGFSYRPSSFHAGALGIAGVLLQTVLLMGLSLWLMRRWMVPLGTMTLLIGVNGAGMTIFNDRLWLAPALIGAGLLADVLLWALKPSGERRARFHGFAFLAPVALYAVYYAAIQLNTGIGWTIHLWLGSIVLAGAAGLFVSFLLLNPFESNDQPTGIA